MFEAVQTVAVVVVTTFDDEIMTRVAQCHGDKRPFRVISFLLKPSVGELAVSKGMREGMRRIKRE